MKYIDKELSVLNDIEQDIISRIVGLNGNPETLVEIGNSYNVTRERIHQIGVKAFWKLIKNQKGNL